MGQFKDVGRADATLMEEMAEAIQVISKCIRFNGDWDKTSNYLKDIVNYLNKHTPPLT